MKKPQTRLDELRVLKAAICNDYLYDYTKLKKLVEEYDFLVEILLASKNKSISPEEFLDLQYFDDTLERED